MSKSTAFEGDVLAWALTAVAPSWDAATDLQVHLHTADPGEAGTAVTAECAYGGYAAVTVARSAFGWTVAGDGTASNAVEVLFPESLSGSEVATHASISPAGDSQILWSGQLDSPAVILAGVQPYFPAGSLQVVED